MSNFPFPVELISEVQGEDEAPLVIAADFCIDGHRRPLF